MTGTIVNVAAVVAGSVVGMLVHSRLPRRLNDVVFQALGLFTIAIGVSMSLRTENMILAVMSLVVGAVIGEVCKIEERLENGATLLQNRMARFGRPAISDDGTADKSGNKTNADEKRGRFTTGFITAMMLYCVGSMAILGPIEDGLGQPPTLLLTKSLMDGISSVALAASFGVGVLFSVVPMLIYQGSITLLAGWFSRVMTDVMIADMTGVGGILLIGIGINILGIKKISVINMLPSLVVIVLLSYFFG
jgi:uncharacterized membrane protein YqgA involved in biofilm formation